MSQSLTLRPIARIHTEFSEKFGIPRQSGLVEELSARIVLEPAYRVREALRGIEGFSHLWLLWQFTESRGWSPTVRPPRLGGNQRVGVFATRSPFRPNPIGLSCVKLDRVDWDAPDGPVLVVRGADLLDGTPLFDIKPLCAFGGLPAGGGGGLFRPAPGGPADRGPFQSACWPRCQRKSAPPCWACSPRTPGPPTSMTPSGCTAWPLPAWR